MSSASENPALFIEQIREFLSDVTAIKEATEGGLTDLLAGWLTAHTVIAAKRLAAKAGPEGLDLKTLRALIADVVALRRGDHSAARLIIEREQLELNRGLSKERMEKQFWEWAMKPENKGLICGSGLSAEEKAKRMREIFGMNASDHIEKPRGGISPETLTRIEKELNLM